MCWKDSAVVRQSDLGAFPHKEQPKGLPDLKRHYIGLVSRQPCKWRATVVSLPTCRRALRGEPEWSWGLPAR